MTRLQLDTLDLVCSPDAQWQEEREEGRAASETSGGGTEASSKIGADEFRGFLTRFEKTMMMAQETEEKKMDEVNRAPTGLEKKVDGLEGQVGTMNQRIEGVEATVPKHDMKFNLIEEPGEKNARRRGKSNRKKENNRH